MADLNEVQASQSVKIAGAGATSGLEGFWAGVDSNGNLQVFPSTAGSVTPGTAASNSNLIGAIYNSTLPTLTTGQQSSLQLDSSGRLIISPSSTTTVTQATAANLNATVVGTGTFAVQAAQSGVWSTRMQDGSGTGLTSNAGVLYVTGGDTAGISNSSRVLTVQGAGVGSTPIVANVASIVGIGLYNSTLPTLTNGTAAAPQLDVNGRLNIRPLTTADSVTSNLSGYSYSSFSPDPSSYPTSNQTTLAIDAVGRLETHATVTTDEGSFRDDFSGSSLTTNITGTLTFTNGSAIVTGSGTSFTTQLAQNLWVKKASDSETFYIQISAVGNDTTFYLAAPYAGTTASGVTGVYSKWKTNTGAGGSIAVATSVATVNSGTTNGSTTGITAIGDYLPYTLNVQASISQRIANQIAAVGFADQWPNPNKQALVQFDGATNTTAKFVTSFSSAAADTQTTAFTYPSSGNSSTSHAYKIDISANQATLLVDGVIVATHTLHLPGPYDSLNIIQQITNSAAVTTTALAVDMFYFSNFDRVQIDSDFNGEPIVVGGNIPDGQPDQGNSLKVGGVYDSVLPTYSSGQRAHLEMDANGRLIISPLTTTTIINANAIPNDGSKASYSAAIVGLVAAATAPTDLFTISGSASKIIRITRIAITASQTTAAQRDVLLIKRSTANTGGTSTSPAGVPHDSTSAAATAVVRAYTANPTGLGTAVGTIRSRKVFVTTPSLNSDEMIVDFGTRPAQAVVLRGVAETLAINLNSVASAGSLFDISIEWTEE